ncbi:MAG: L-serine ammonia-lyase, iron-sulfur-dependent, subunit beta, partial [Gemmatimonadetes bacterium HGW-Gemmatimonadetes-1]
MIELHGSFARTGVGHGTDRAIVGGLLGYLPDDERLRESLVAAESAGVAIEFKNTTLRGDHHPNTTHITVKHGDLGAVLVGSSIGAGRIVVTAIDGFPVEISGAYTTLVAVAKDVPGIVASVAGALAEDTVNLATMRVSR